MTLAKVARWLNSGARPRSGAHPGPPPLPPLILVTDGERLGDPVPAAARLPPGSAVLLRHAGAPGRAALARRLKRLCRARRLRLLIAGDARLARRVGADGLHLSEALARGPSPRGGGRRAGWLVTAAAHSRAALIRAARCGADAALLSPVFPTASHPGARALGPARFAALARASPLPVYGLGGIGCGNARRLVATGAVGIAALGALIPPGERGPRGSTGSGERKPLGSGGSAEASRARRRGRNL